MKGKKNHRYKHGMSNTPTWNSWRGMHKRCTRPGPRDNAYKGVTICDRWRDFENFLADMGERPHGTTLDRRDPARGYEPDNCRWATPKQQAESIRHRRDLIYKNSPLAEVDGKPWTLTMLARNLGVSVQALRYRFKNGLPLEAPKRKYIRRPR